MPSCPTLTSGPLPGYYDADLCRRRDPPTLLRTAVMVGSAVVMVVAGSLLQGGAAFHDQALAVSRPLAPRAVAARLPPVVLNAAHPAAPARPALPTPDTPPGQFQAISNTAALKQNAGSLVMWIGALITSAMWLLLRTRTPSQWSVAAASADGSDSSSEASSKPPGPPAKPAKSPFASGPKNPFGLSAPASGASAPAPPSAALPSLSAGAAAPPKAAAPPMAKSPFASTPSGVPPPKNPFASATPAPAAKNPFAAGAAPKANPFATPQNPFATSARSGFAGRGEPTLQEVEEQERNLPTPTDPFAALKDIRPQDILRQSLGLVTYVAMIVLVIATFQVVNLMGAIRIG